MNRLEEFEDFISLKFGTQAGFAQALDVAQNTVSQWISKGEIPTRYHQKLTELGYLGRFRVAPASEMSELKGWLSARFDRLEKNQATILAVIRALSEDEGIGKSVRDRLQALGRELQ